MYFFMEYLLNYIFEDDMMCLVYGDYWVGNLFINEDDYIIVVVFDWELLILGYLLVDFVYCCIFYYLFSD